jgi:hypothetical protein
MNESYVLRFDGGKPEQSPEDNSFVGGKPKLPPGTQIPVCGLCESEQSFMFQVSLPDGLWAGLSLATFACTSCAQESRLIPAIVKGAVIPEGFLEDYQVNFRFLVFETSSGVLHTNFRERVRFKRIHVEATRNPDLHENKIGGNPTWLLDDEAPTSYGGKTSMFFLLQLLQGFQFEIIQNAPPQIELSLDGSPQASPLPYYQLFLGNALFLFGTEDVKRPLVYAITQI